jgi:hypothetical protein
MKRQKKSSLKNYLFLAAIVFAFLFAANYDVAAQNYKAGDRAECEVTGNPNGKYWVKGTIQPFKDGDFGAGVEPDGSWFRFKADANKVEYFCKPDVLRPIAGTETKQPVKTKPNPQPEETTPEEENETMPDGDFVECPVEQKQVKNGARPNAELAKKIIRCKKGEKAVEEGDEGAVTVEISAIQIGASRPWSYSQDLGNAKPGTVVYPVKATYTVKTHYRTATEVEEGWIRIFNFYVNAFGEWQIGSEENVKSPKVKRIPK